MCHIAQLPSSYASGDQGRRINENCNNKSGFSNGTLRVMRRAATQLQITVCCCTVSSLHGPHELSRLRHIAILLKAAVHCCPSGGYNVAPVQPRQKQCAFTEKQDAGQCDK